MELIEDLDPEEARALVDPALKLMMDAVHHYGGYVAQSTGDGIFALFGASESPMTAYSSGAKSCAVRINLSAPSWIHWQRSANVRVASRPEERQRIVVVGHRDSNHPEACGQENRFNFRLRPKRTPKPMDIQEVHSIGCASQMKSEIYLITPQAMRAPPPPSGAGVSE